MPLLNYGAVTPTLRRVHPAAVAAEVVRPLRAEVLRPGRPSAELIYPGDEAPDTLHAAVLLDGEVVGVASVMRYPHPRAPLADDWRIRGMASRPELRGRGIGAALLASCEAHGRGHDGVRIWCNARAGARGFYERGGFSVEGECFEIAGIGPHHLMVKPLRP